MTLYELGRLEDALAAQDELVRSVDQFNAESRRFLFQLRDMASHPSHGSHPSLELSRKLIDDAWRSCREADERLDRYRNPG